MAEVASAFVTLIPSAKGFKGKLENEIGGDLDRAGEDGGKRYGNATKGAAAGILSKAGPLLAAAFTGAAAASLVSFVSSAIGSASDLNETINKANTIFGSNAAVIQAWAEDAASNLGLSRQAALDTATGFGNMLSQIGFTGAEAAKLSTEIVTLSADLGSFNNLPTADVADRISAAFRGEYDSLQLLIPNINAARVEQEALAATGKSVASELTAQEKATAVLAIVSKDGAAALGDFAKTSDGLANQQKILQAEFANVKTEIGTALLPVAQAFMGFVLREGVPALKSLIQTVKDNKEAIFTFGETLAKIALTVAEGFLNLAATLAESLAGQTRNLRDFVGFMLTFADGVLAAADAAFGWLPGVGDKIDTARTKLRDLENSAFTHLTAVSAGFQKTADGARAAAGAVGGISDRIAALRDRRVTVTVDYQQVGSITNVPYKQRALGGPVRAGEPYLVGERGPEMIVPTGAGQVLTASQTARLAGSNGDSTASAVNALRGDVQSLVRSYTQAQRQGVA